MSRLSAAFLLSVTGVLGLAAAKEFKEGDPVTVWVNKVGPYSNPQETYHYYQLPVCRPDTIRHKSLTLGEVLDGDRMAESLYEIKFRKDRPLGPLCKSKTVAGKDFRFLVSAIEESYYFEFIADDLPMRNFVGRLEEKGLFPHNHQVFLHTHHHFVFEYNGANIISAKVLVSKQAPLLLDESKDSVIIDFTYAVEWKSTEKKPEDRRSLLDEDAFFPQTLEIHWLSVLNSALLVLLLLGFVVLILVRIVHSDLIRYNAGPDEVERDAEGMDNGWKVIHTDVFRFPAHRSLFAAILGCGAQLLSITAIILTIGSLELINVHRHGLINALALILYAFTSGIAGFVSGKWYRRLGGTEWVRNINHVSCLFSLPAFAVWATLNSLAWAYQSTQALPATTVILLGAIFALVGYPLTVLGGILGKNAGGRYEAPCRTRNIPRELPPLPWYHSSGAFLAFGGFLPFSAISVELYYIFATIWGHEHYTLYGILLIVFGILMSVTACVAVAATYFQLSAEDYRWWWRSLVVGGSTGLFVQAYAVFFYTSRSSMSGVLQSVQYFGYVGLLCYAFALAMATISFAASHRFVRYIYASVKTD